MTTPPLRSDRAVRAWVIAGGISAIGDRIWQIALAWTAVQVASPGMAAFVIASSAVSRCLLLLVGGVLADRLATRPVLIAANSARMLVLGIGIAAVGIGGVSLGALLFVAIAFGAVDALGDPAMSTMPRQMIRSDDLGPASAMFDLSGRLATFVGAPIGGVLIAVGFTTSLLVDLLSFAVIGVVIWTLLRPRYPIQRQPATTIRREVRGALSYVGRDRSVRTLFVALCGLNVLVSPVLAVGVALRVHDAGWSVLWLGITNSALGIGGAIGAVFGMLWRPRRPAALGFGLLIAQGAAAALVGVPAKAVVVAAAAVVGVTAGLASAQLSAVYIALVEPTYLGRVGSLNQLADQALLPAATGLFGILAARTGLATTTAIFGGTMVLLMLWSLSRPAIREHRRTAPSRVDPVAAGT